MAQAGIALGTSDSEEEFDESIKFGVPVNLIEIFFKKKPKPKLKVCDYFDHANQIAVCIFMKLFVHISARVSWRLVVELSASLHTLDNAPVIWLSYAVPLNSLLIHVVRL